MAEARTYRDGVATPSIGEVVALHLSNNAVAQVSAFPGEQENGFLLRVWPPNGTHEYGGDNGTLLSVAIRFDDGGNVVLEGLDWNGR